MYMHCVVIIRLKSFSVSVARHVLSLCPFLNPYLVKGCTHAIHC